MPGMFGVLSTPQNEADARRRLGRERFQDEWVPEPMARRAPATAASPTSRSGPHGRTPAERAANVARAELASRKLDLHGVTVLIVDDDPDSRDMVQQVVYSFGASVAAAADGREALRIASWMRPDLILCDLRMPVIDGFGFIERLRHDPNLSRTAVLAVTALGSEADIRRTWEAGFDGHLVKPIDYQTIAAQLERIFWAHRKRDAPKE
jgi:CheY-like chemotaxis protein